MAFFPGKRPVTSLAAEFFSLTSVEINDYVAAFYIVGGVIAIITGVGELLLYFTSR